MALWRLYGARGWGSTLAEGVLAWAGVPFEFEDVEGFDTPGPERDLLLAVNPLARVPTLVAPGGAVLTESRSEEHTSELQSLMRISYAVFCLKKKHKINTHNDRITDTNKTSQIQNNNR